MGWDLAARVWIWLGSAVRQSDVMRGGMVVVVVGDGREKVGWNRVCVCVCERGGGVDCVVCVCCVCGMGGRARACVRAYRAVVKVKVDQLDIGIGETFPGGCPHPHPHPLKTSARPVHPQSCPYTHLLHRRLGETLPTTPPIPDRWPDTHTHTNTTHRHAQDARTQRGSHTHIHTQGLRGTRGEREGGKETEG